MLPSIQFTAVKKNFGSWVFDYGDITEEPLVNGTDLVMDWFYTFLSHTPPQLDDTMEVKVFTEEPLFYETHLTWESRDETEGSESNYYRCSRTGMKVWLCPVNQLLLDGVKKDIWVQFSVDKAATSLL